MGNNTAKKKLTKRHPKDWDVISARESDAEHIYVYSLIRLSSQSYGIVEWDLINWQNDQARLVYVVRGLTTTVNRMTVVSKLHEIKEDLNNQSHEDYDFAMKNNVNEKENK